MKKHKTLVRKLASKRPVSQKTAQQNYITVNYNAPQPVQQQYNQTEFASRTAQPKYRGNVSFNSATKVQQNQDIDDFQRIPVTNAPNLYQKINNLTEDANSQEKKQDTSRNYENTYNFRSQSRYRPSPKPTTAAPATTAEVRLPSTAYLQNIANNYQQPATLINNQLQDSAEYRKPVEYQGYNNQAYDYTFQQFKQPTSNQSPSTKYQTVSQNYYETSTPLATQNKSTDFQSFYQPNTTVFDYYKYYQTSTTSYQQKAKNYYSTTTTTTSPKYDPYATFQKSNEKYDEDEFLKTAPSSNLKPSDINAIYNQKKNAYVNATLKAAYNIEPHKASYYQAKAAAAPGTSQTYRQPPSTITQNLYQPTTTSTQANYYQAAVTNAPQNNYYQQSVTSSPQTYYQSAATNAPAQNNYYQSVATNAPQNYYQSAATNTPAQNYQSGATNAPAQNYYQSPSTNAPAQNYYLSSSTNAQAQNYYQSAATNAPQNNYYQTVTTKAPQKPSYYQPTPSSTVKPAVTKQTSATASKASTANASQKPDYDYAYYDNAGGSSEYDGFENVEDFARIKNAKHT